MWYETLLGYGIVISFILIIASKVTKQSIPEMLKSIIDLFREKGEDLADDGYEPYLN